MRIQPGRMESFEQLPPIQNPVSPAPGGTTEAQTGPNPFMARLADAVREVNQVQQEGSAQAEKLATGQADNLQEVVLAVEKADLALQLTVQVTQKAVDAYREISRMQV